MTITIPQWRVADRMRRSMDEAGYSTAAIAAELGVSSESVSRWINGRGEPRRTTLIAWAQLCSVPLWWLEDGEPEGIARPERLELPTFCSVADLDREAAFWAIVEPAHV